MMNELLTFGRIPLVRKGILVWAVCFQYTILLRRFAFSVLLLRPPVPTPEAKRQEVKGTQAERDGEQEDCLFPKKETGKYI